MCSLLGRPGQLCSAPSLTPGTSEVTAGSCDLEVAAAPRHHGAWTCMLTLASRAAPADLRTLVTRLSLAVTVPAAVRCHGTRAGHEPSRSLKFNNDYPTRAFSWLNV